VHGGCFQSSIKVYFTLINNVLNCFAAQALFLLKCSPVLLYGIKPQPLEKGKIMQASEIMTTSVKSVSSGTPLTEAVSLMCLYRYSGIPVVDDGKLIGIIAEKDILASLLPNADDLKDGMAAIDFNKLMSDYAGILKGIVSDLMTHTVKSVPADMHILKAAALMAGYRFRRIPVTDGDQLLGMLSFGDIHKAIFHKNISIIAS